MTINAVRTSRYWVINCNAAVRSTISKCVRYKIFRGIFQQQQMTDLPKDRISEEPNSGIVELICLDPLPLRTVARKRNDMVHYSLAFHQEQCILK